MKGGGRGRRENGRMTPPWPSPSAEAISKGGDARDEAVQDTIVARWLGWSRTAKDVGIQTQSVLSGAAREGISAERARAEAAKVHQRTGRSAGNGSLMRTAPLALAYLDDEQALVEAARAISELTHFDSDAGDACVLWTVAIRHAVLTAELDVRWGCVTSDAERRELWSGVWTSRRPRVLRTSTATGGRWPPCRPRGRRSSTVPGPDAPRADHLG